MGVPSQSTPTSRTAFRIIFGVGAVGAMVMVVSLFNMKKPSDNEERESPAKGGSRRTRRIHRMCRANHGTRKA
jgi:hypothetical protein